MSGGAVVRLRQNITELTATLVTGLWLALLFLPIGGNLWLAVLLFGYIVVVPLVALLFGDEQARQEWWEGADDTAVTDTDDARSALETLRTRYAAGELTDEQFERKLERLLEVETLEDAEQWYEQHQTDGEQWGRGLEYER